MIASESNAITYLRAISMLMIISCHICQVYSNHWAFVLNLGVQIFFVISGSLYGSRHITNWKTWFYGRLRKLYVPFALYLLIVLPFYAVFHRECLSIISLVVYALDLQGMYWGGVIPGLNHLWFLTDICICYVLTPLLQYLSEIKSSVLWRWLIIICLACVLFIVIIKYDGWHYNVLLFGIAYMIGRMQYRAEKLTIFVAISVAAMLIVWDMSWDTVLGGGVLSYVWRIISSLLVFMVFILMYRFLDISCQPVAVRNLSQYSYYAYIVHHVYIIGPFSVIAALNFHLISIAYVITLIIFSTIFLYKVSTLVEKHLVNFLVNENRNSNNMV